jgi:hypothetical protein
MFYNRVHRLLRRCHQQNEIIQANEYTIRSLTEQVDLISHHAKIWEQSARQTMENNMKFYELLLTEYELVRKK